MTVEESTNSWTLTLPRGESGDLDLERSLLHFIERQWRVMCERHRKYGPGNIAEGGRAGIINRLRDKLARIEHGDMDVEDEKYEDTLIDAANYGAILGLWEEGKWPCPETCVPLCRGCGRPIT